MTRLDFTPDEIADTRRFAALQAAAIDATQLDTVFALDVGHDTFLFASADTLAGHAERAVHDGATEKFEQDHGRPNISGGQQDHA